MPKRFYLNQRILLILFSAILFLLLFWLRWQPRLVHYFSPPISPVTGHFRVDHAASFFQNTNTFEMNQYETLDGLFSFEYSNHLAVKQHLGVSYLRDLKNNRVVFQIFENKPYFSFREEDFNCIQYEGIRSAFKSKEVCFSKNPPKDFIANLTIFGEVNRFFKEVVQFFEKRGLIQSSSFHYYDFFSRADAVEFVLRWKYPYKDFSDEADDCFLDVSKEDSGSGYICFAKKEGILVGIGGKFYPEQSINLHGLLKILFMTFGIEDRSFNESLLNSDLFEQMQKIHVAYPLIAKAYYEGLFTNLTDQIHWANRHVIKGEALSIMTRFFEWTMGKQIKKYHSKPAFNQDTKVYLKKDDYSVIFEEESDESFDEDDIIVTTKLITIGNDLDIYFLDEGGVYRYLYSLKDTIEADLKSVFASFDTQRLKGKLILFYENGAKKGFKLKRKKIDQSNLKTLSLGQQNVEVINRLEVAGLLPNVVQKPSLPVHPELKIYMSPQDFESIFIHRTGNDRYPAYLEMIYPDGSLVSRSILIKTRGNANRGYIKSGFTIESFQDFNEDLQYEGDEFLEGSDEFKLRGFINEETMIHEKLFYGAFRSLGYFAPRFFDSTVEINGIPLGFYQVTEPIKKPFFKSRNLDVDDYYYARNSGSIYNTNLGYYESDEITLSQYKYNSNPNQLIRFIKRIEEGDPSLMNDLNLENIVDYAITVFLLRANDSLTHNFYIYFDNSSQKWNIFPWDADDALYSVAEFNIWDFLEFARKNEGSYNELIYYVFQQLSFDEMQDYFDRYRQNWSDLVDLPKEIDKLLEVNSDYYRYDNQLWNGRFLERKKYNFDTIQAIKNLKSIVSPLNNLN